MKYFDRTSNSVSKDIVRQIKKLSRLSAILNSLTILFVLVLGLNQPNYILDHTNFTLETKTFVKRDETKLALKTPVKNLPATTITSAQNFAKTTAATQSVVVKATKPASPTFQNYITLAGRNIEIFRSSNTNINAGSRVGLYGSGFLYGHNSPAVFGSLGSVSTFSVTLNGVTKNYRVANKITLPKTCANSSECAEKYMGAGGLTPKHGQPKYRGKTYDLVLMTCAGTPTTPGDATHRLIIFANEY